MLPDWLQNLSDITANNHIRLTIIGEMNNLDAELEIKLIGCNEYMSVAEVVGEFDIDSLMESLISEFDRRNLDHGPHVEIIDITGKY